MYERHTTHMPWIRLLAIGTAGVLGLTACGGDGEAESSLDEGAVELTVAFDWIPNVQYGGFWLAEANGYYEDAGLDIEWIPGGPEAPSVAATLAGGSADIGVDNMNRAVNSMADNDFTIIGSVFQENPACMLWLPDNPVEEPEDLVGMRILAQNESELEALFEANDLGDDYEFVPTSFDPGPLLEGDGDVYTAFYVNQPVTLELDYGMVEGEDYGCTLYSDLGMPTYANTIFAHTSGIEENRDAYVAFLEATKRGWEDFQADPASGAELAVTEYGVDLGLDIEQQTLQAERQTGLIENELTDEHGILYMDFALIDSEIRAGLEASGVEDPPAAEDMVDLSLLDEID